MSIKTFTISITNQEREILRHALAVDMECLTANRYGDVAGALLGRLGLLESKESKCDSAKCPNPVIESTKVSGDLGDYCSEECHETDEFEL